MLWDSPLSYQKRRKGILVRLESVTRGRVISSTLFDKIFRESKRRTPQDRPTVSNLRGVKQTSE